MVRHWGCRFRCVWFWGCFQTFWADFAFKLLDARLRNCRNCLQLVPLCKFMISKHSWSFVPIRRWGCFAGSSQCFLVRYHSAVITSNGDVATFGSKITKCWKLSSLLLWRWSTPSGKKCQEQGNITKDRKSVWTLSPFLGIDPVRRSLVEEFVHGTTKVLWFPTSKFLFLVTVEWFVLTGSHWKGSHFLSTFSKLNETEKIPLGIGGSPIFGIFHRNWKEKKQQLLTTDATDGWLKVLGLQQVGVMLLMQSRQGTCQAQNKRALKKKNTAGGGGDMWYWHEGSKGCLFFLRGGKMMLATCF